MKKMTLLSLSLVLLAVTRVDAQAPAAQGPENPFDLSAASELMGDLGLPTVQGLGEIEKQAQQLVASGDCKTAIDVLDKYARKSNSLANLIASGLEPFYDASYDDRKSFSPSRLQSLVPFESSANLYKGKRNEAMIMQAECFVKLGEQQKAASLYYRVLQLTKLDDWESWERARKGLYALLGVQ